MTNRLEELKKEARGKILERIKNAREFGWEGGFKPEFLADFIVDEQFTHIYTQAIQDAIGTLTFTVDTRSRSVDFAEGVFESQKEAIKKLTSLFPADK